MITNTGIVIDENASAAEQILAEAAQQNELSRFGMPPGAGGETVKVARILVVEDHSASRRCSSQR